VIGIADDRLELLGPEAKNALTGARVVAGGRRHLALLASWNGAAAPETLEITADTAELVSRIRVRLADGSGPICVLASGDPGFFGIVRALVRSLDRHQLRVLPAPSSVALAFARLGLPWDDAAVVSAHGRPLAEAVRAARGAPKVAVLTAPDAPPELVGRALLEAGCTVDLAAVCSRLGSTEEQVQELSLAELAEGSFDPLSVVILVGRGGLPLTGWRDAGMTLEERDGRVLAWGRNDSTYLHRDGMITKAETRSVILGKLWLPMRGVLWDVGAGSGSVAIECALVAPGLTVFAVESDAESAERIRANAAAAGVGVQVITGRAPEVLGELPAPDRAFVGGGGIEVLRAVLGRLVPGGRVVAAFASMERAAEGAGLLGHLLQIHADRGERLPDGSWRLVSNNPVFVAWGPGEDGDQ
jgi:precorrin-6Y C5,15-methyltransferase (decarboxylating)